MIHFTITNATIKKSIIDGISKHPNIALKLANTLVYLLLIFDANTISRKQPHIRRKGNGTILI